MTTVTPSTIAMLVDESKDEEIFVDCSDGSDLSLSSDLTDASFPSCNNRLRSIIRKSSLDGIDMFVKDEEGCWKSLPAPDLRVLRDSLRTSPSENAAENPKQLERTDTSSSSVSFGDVAVRRYERTAGEVTVSPETGVNVCVQLDWDFQEVNPVSVDAYESKRGPRRGLEELFLSREERQSMVPIDSVISSVVPDDEAAVAKRVAESAGRSPRRGSFSLNPFRKIDKALASLARKHKQKNRSKAQLHLMAPAKQIRASNC